jgi:hypothetical protein
MTNKHTRNTDLTTNLNSKTHKTITTNYLLKTKLKQKVRSYVTTICEFEQNQCRVRWDGKTFNKYFNEASLFKYLREELKSVRNSKRPIPFNGAPQLTQKRILKGQTYIRPGPCVRWTAHKPYRFEDTAQSALSVRPKKVCYSVPTTLPLHNGTFFDSPLCGSRVYCVWNVPRGE